MTIDVDQTAFERRGLRAPLKQRRWVAAALLAVGLVGLACYVLLVPGSTLPEFAQGFYLGAASGITAGALILLILLILLIRCQYLLTHPEARKRARIKETDERERKIVETAFRWAGAVSFFGSAAALFVVLPLSRPAFTALVAVMAVYALSFLAASAWLERKM